MAFRSIVGLLLISVYLLISNFPPLVAAGPGGYVSLINGSPYDWKSTYSHSYQMDWQPAALIPAGTSHEQYLEFWYHWGDNGDCAAEVIYELVGSPEYTAFKLHAIQDNGKMLKVQYLGALSSLNNQRHSLINLGFEHDGGVSFILAGDGGMPYVSSNPPAAWMQATLFTIGSRTLRQIAIPASHDAGMSGITQAWVGTFHNTATQTDGIYEQLLSGARWLDIRPVSAYRHEAGAGTEFYVGHFSEAKVFKVVGATGISFEKMIAAINRFTAENPGELIILDLTHELDGDEHWKWGFTTEQWQALYEVLGDIKDLWEPDDDSIPQDFTSVPLRTFIQPGSNSAVLIRIPGHAPFPLGGEQNENLPLSAFVPDYHFPFEGSYSNTDNPNTLARDQVAKLQSMRATTEAKMQRSTWTITVGIWKMLDVANWKNSIIGQAIHAHRKLFSSLWPAMSKSTYPNLIEVDNFKDSQVTALCMGINSHFATGKKVERRESSVLRRLIPRLPLLA